MKETQWHDRLKLDPMNTYLNTYIHPHRERGEREVMASGFPVAIL